MLVTQCREMLTIEPILTNFNRRWIDNIIGHRGSLKILIKADEHGTCSNTAGSEEECRGNSHVVLAYGLVNDSSNIIANVCDLIGCEVPSNLIQSLRHLTSSQERQISCAHSAPSNEHTSTTPSPPLRAPFYWETPRIHVRSLHQSHTPPPIYVSTPANRRLPHLTLPELPPPPPYLPSIWPTHALITRNDPDPIST